MINLEEKEILQIDATVITGILILLTISFAGEDGTQTKKNEIIWAEIGKILWTVTIIIPFAVSAVWVIHEAEKSSTPNFGWPITWMKIGFLYIMIGIGSIAVLQIIILYI